MGGKAALTNMSVALLGAKAKLASGTSWPDTVKPVTAIVHPSMTSVTGFREFTSQPKYWSEAVSHLRSRR